MADQMADDILCIACGEVNPERARFCLSCGLRLDGGEAGPRGERRLVSVLFADLSGFTSFSERSDVEVVRALADEAAARLGEIVEHHGGIVDKIIGDCVMAIFGAPVAHEDDPLRALRAGLEMRDLVQRERDRFAKLPLRIGIHTGEAMFAPIGADGRFTVLGDTVNTAARLQSAAPRDGILVGEPTFLATADEIDFEEVAAIVAKGKEHPIPAWRAIARKGARRRAAAASPFVGRTRELARLSELWERTRADRRRRLIVLTGEPGIGKTRIIDHFISRASASGDVFRGQCLSYGEGITYWPVTEMIRQAAGILAGDEPAAVSTKLDTFLTGLGSDDLEELRTIAVAVANLFGAEATPRGTYRATQISKAELHWGIRRLFELHAADRPVLLVFEDLHWAEPTLLELLTSVLENDQPTSLVVIGSGRPELVEHIPPLWTDHSSARMMRVERLSGEDAESLVAALTGLALVPPGPLAELLQRAAGNPLFLEETVRALRDAGVVDEDGSLIVEKANAVALPSSLRSLIAARLDRLPTGARRAAQTASVAGATFWEQMLYEIQPEQVTRADDLSILEDQDVVFEEQISSIAGEREFAFRHALIRDVAYERVPKTVRSEVHARCGTWLGAHQSEEFIEIIAHHLEQSCLLAIDVQHGGVEPPVLAAVDALKRAAERAEAREGLREASRFYARALVLAASRMPETALEMSIREARMRSALGDASYALARFDEARSEAAELGRVDLRCAALLSMGNLEQALAKVSDASAHLIEAQALAEQMADLGVQSRVALELGSLRVHYQGDADGIHDLERGLDLAQRCGEALTQIEAHMRLGSHLLNMGELADAEEHFTRVVDLSNGASLRTESSASFMLATVWFYRGPREAAYELAMKAQAGLERTNDRYPLVQNMRTLAKLALAEGDGATAEQWLAKALPLALELGGWLPADLDLHLVQALGMQGRWEEAREAARHARANAPPEDPYSGAAAALAEGLVELACADTEVAGLAFEEALRLIEKQGLSIDLAEANLTVARALWGRGQVEGCTSYRERARALFEQAGAHAMLADIDRMTLQAREPAS